MRLRRFDPHVQAYRLWSASPSALISFGVFSPKDRTVKTDFVPIATMTFVVSSLTSCGNPTRGIGQDKAKTVNTAHSDGERGERAVIN